MARYREPTTDESSSDALEEDADAAPRLSPSVRAQIGRRLRDFYAALALGEKPVPDHFIELINRLDQRPRGARQETRS